MQEPVACVHDGVGKRDLKQTTTATATRTWKNKRSNLQNNSSAHAFEQWLSSCVLQLCTFPGRPWQNKNVKSPNYAKKRTPITNYSRFLTSNCWPHSHAMLKGKSGTVSDNEDIEPLVNYIGETKVDFDSDVMPSLAVMTPWTPYYRGYTSIL